MRTNLIVVCEGLEAELVVAVLTQEVNCRQLQRMVAAWDSLCASCQMWKLRAIKEMRYDKNSAADPDPDP